MTNSAPLSDELTLMARPTCPLPSTAPDSENIVMSGRMWICPDCGRVWFTAVVGWPGSQLLTIWQCPSEPPVEVPSP